MRLAILLAALALSACATAPADKVIVNASIFTANDEQPHALALAVRDGRIIAIGSNEDIERHIGDDTEVLDLAGKIVTPPLVDSHYHLRGVGMRELTLNLAGITDLNTLLDTVKQFADAHPDRAWITGRGWLETHFDPPVFPTRHDLDRVVPDRPVFLTRADGHGGVANTKALELAQITPDTRSPQGGDILRDAHGVPTGMLIDTAQRLITRHIPESDITTKEALRVGGQVAQAQGWSGVHAVLDSWEEVDALRHLYEHGEMPIDIYAAVRWPSPGAEHLLTTGPHHFDGIPLTVRAIKINLDGALGSRGAALLEDYSDDPGNNGLLYYTEDELRAVLTRARDAGIQVWTHAIGDRANRLILDLYEEVLGEQVGAVLRTATEGNAGANGEANVGAAPSRRDMPDHRWRIEHAQHLTAEDIPRFAELGVIASMQPSHAIGDLHFAPARLGMDRLEYAYAWRDLIESGATVIGGSDAPVEVGDPCIELHAASTRTDLTGYSGEGWHPEQAVSKHEAVKMFTVWAAEARFEQRLPARIAIDGPAEFTILDCKAR